MFPGRKRNVKYPGIAESYQSKESVYGIDWERRKARRDINDYQLLNEGVKNKEEKTKRDKYFNQPVGELDWNLPNRETKELLIDEANDKHHNQSTTCLQKRPDFYDQHKKVTIYMEKELMETISKLKKERYIPSYSWLVAEAIRFYLQEKNKS